MQALKRHWNLAKAKSKEKGYDGVYFSLFVGLATRVRIEVVDIRL
jgi:hypothetical protein